MSTTPLRSSCTRRFTRGVGHVAGATLIRCPTATVPLMDGGVLGTGAATEQVSFTTSNVCAGGTCSSGVVTASQPVAVACTSYQPADTSHPKVPSEAVV